MGQTPLTDVEISCGNASVCSSSIPATSHSSKPLDVEGRRIRQTVTANAAAQLGPLHAQHDAAWRDCARG